MSDKTGIEWTEATWNPMVGCTHVSAGCDNCYAAREASGRLSGHPAYEGLAVDGKFTGKIRLLPDRLEQPSRWRKPRRIFVNSMSDLFHPGVPARYVAEVFGVMARNPRHTFQVLTKRPERAREFLRGCADPEGMGWITHNGKPVDGAYAPRGEGGVIVGYAEPTGDRSPATGRRGGQPRYKATPPAYGWPLPNVWLGTSVEDQATADRRIPVLLEAPAAVHWLSCEPLLGPVDLEVSSFIGGDWLKGIDWVVAGGESGPAARPMHPDWARMLRDQCTAAGVPFLFKQWGEWRPYQEGDLASGRSGQLWDGPTGDDRLASMVRAGKKAAGRELDGRIWDEYPTVVPA